jgi:hypothetical protein
MRPVRYVGQHQLLVVASIVVGLGLGEHFELA